MNSYKNFDEFLAQFPHIHVASKNDNQEILDFYHETSISTKKSKIIYKRGNDFFSFLRERSHDSLILILKDDNHKIQGMGVLSFRVGWIHHEWTTIGYLGDLRVKLNRTLIREWREMYSNLILHSPFFKETFYCKYFQTALIDSNLESKSNLANTKIKNLHYQKLAAYKMINIIGRIKNNNFTYLIKKANALDHERILHFLNNHQKKGLFAHDWNLELPHRLKNWSNFNYENIILILDQNQELISLTFIWNPGQTKQVQLTQIPHSFSLLKIIKPFLPFVEIKEIANKNTTLNILYLHAFHFNNSIDLKKQKNIVHEVVHFLFKEDFHVLAFADFENYQFFLDNKTFLKEKIPMSLYSVHYKENNNQIVNPLFWTINESSPEFDMSLV